MASPATLWGRLEPLLAAQNFSALALAVGGIDDAERGSLRAVIDDFLKHRYERPHGYGSEAGLGIVAAAAAPDARVLTRMLQRLYLGYSTQIVDRSGEFPYPHYESHTAVAYVHFVLRERQPLWLSELVGALARVLPKDPRYRDDLFHLIERLRDDTGAPMPITDGYVGLWTRVRSENGDLDAATRAEAGRVELIERMLQLDSVAGYLGTDFRFARDLARLTADGTLERRSILDAVLQRMAQPIKTGAARAYLAVHDQLLPSDEEVAARVPRYVAIVRGSTAAPVAAAAHQRLLALRVDGRLADTDWAAVTAAALGRSEKKLVRAQLASLTRSPATFAVACAIASAAPGLPSDLAREAVKVLAKLAADLPEIERTALAELARELPRDLHAALSAGLGVRPTAAQERVEPAPEPSDVSSAPAVPSRVLPITDPAELADLLPTVLQTLPTTVESEVLERCVDALVRWAGRPELRSALAPVLSSGLYAFARTEARQFYGEDTPASLVGLIAAAVGDPPGAYQWRPSPALAPERALRLRFDELSERLRGGWAGRVVSTPTWTDGRLAADDLLARLSEAREGGWEPVASDLEQAVLRLDRRAPLHAASFAELSTAPGDTVARVLAGGLAVPLVGLTRAAPPPWAAGDLSRAGPRRLVTLRPADGADLLGPIHEAMSRLEDPQPGAYVHQSFIRCWPATWPTEPDVVAAHGVQELAGARQVSASLPVLLPRLGALVDQTSGIGSGLAYALAYGLAVHRPVERATAAAAVVELAQRAKLNELTLADAITDLAVGGDIAARRVVEALRPVATGSMAAALYPLLAALVSSLIAVEPAIAGTADVLRLAADAAERARPTDKIAGLAEFAGRRGSSRQLVEARRLVALIDAEISAR